MVNDCDVLIVGGGLVGTSLALALARAPLRTWLLEAGTAAPGSAAAAPPPGNAQAAGERYLALSRASMNALGRLGVRGLLGDQPEPIRAVHVSRRDDFGRVLLTAREAGRDDFGAVVPASLLGQTLAQALQQALARSPAGADGSGPGGRSAAPGLAHLAPARLQALAPVDGAVVATVATTSGVRELRAGLVVGADGAGSKVAAGAGLPVERHDYGQEAVVFAASCSRPHRGIAYERFTGGGALAALPLPGRRVGMVWTRRRHAASGQGPAPDPEAVLVQVQREFGQRLGRLHTPGPCATFPLHQRWLQQVVAGRVVVVGNAAQSLHPVAAQGFNLGLRDALVLAEMLAAAADTLPDDAAQVLSRYQDRRLPDRQRIAGLSHALARWPGLELPGLGWLRSLGFAALNAGTGLRQSLMLAAMGFAADAPAAVLEDVAGRQP